MSDNTQLLSICSPGHSGSTLLNLIAGSMSRAFSCGELQWLPWQLSRNGKEEKGVERQDICTCLKSFNDCLIWHKVLDELSSKEGYDIRMDPYRFRITLLKKQEYTKIKPPLYSKLPYLLYRRAMCNKSALWATAFARGALQPVIRRNWHLIDTIGKVTGANVVIDSSKDLVRFHMLSYYRPKQTYLIILARDVRRIASSAIKYGRNPIVAAQNWHRFYLYVRNFLRSNDQIPMLFIRYEELCSNPEKLRRQISLFTGQNEPGPVDSMDTRNYHMVAGNPMRYAGPLLINRDDSWKTHIQGSTIESTMSEIEQRTRSIFSEIEQYSMSF